MKPGKKTPVMNVFDDWNTPTIRRMVAKLRSSLKEWGYEYLNLKPDASYPMDFPRDIKELYDRAFAELPERTREDDTGDD